MTATRAFQYSHTIGMYAQIGRGFNNPVDVAVGRNEALYVLNRAGSDIAPRMAFKRVLRCTLSEDFHGEFSHGGTADGELMWPTSITIDAAQRLYISDEALHRISVFDADGQFLYKWGAQGHGEGAFDRPAGLAVDADGHLLVADGLNHRIQRYTKDGKFLGQWGGHGSGDGKLNVPWGVAADADNQVYVADWRNDRIQKFDAQGAHLATWGAPGSGEGKFHRPAGVAVDAEGLIYVADWGNERVQILEPDGRFLTLLRGDAGVSKWGQDYFISNQDELEERQRANLEPELDLLPSDGPREVSASIEKLFWGPTSVKLDDAGRLYVVDSCRHRIQVYAKT